MSPFLTKFSRAEHNLNGRNSRLPIRYFRRLARKRESDRSGLIKHELEWRIIFSFFVRLMVISPVAKLRARRVCVLKKGIFILKKVLPATGSAKMRSGDV